MQSASDQSRGHFVRVTWIRVYRDDFWNDFSMRLLIIIHSSVKFLMSFCTLLINYSRRVLMPLASDYVAFLAVLGVVASLHAHTSGCYPPRLASSRCTRTSPRLASPRCTLTSPHLASPRCTLTSPHLASPRTPGPASLP